ncbi:uncharacterized protein TRIADDRAFT_38377 [Trichoplax adhaerens]|uniref:Major facilitator superfamily (MFS) profile domain-containing protein n=1 Tax=Trichoplax adhaerens TaxID=10228 RepID=B3SA04_TRIAD|nr:hypothetical protein TRIADDRAFT_38377 [Trichoplax adhaerens]EDV20428.1 hypothetical protein TRIADDRAFT_38377 [Trichoplax adhaerens]|eukprot:XP_002117122.1 hypothetical protein TRIADDRAFT_38377 [Trichoplax adhaerens]
MGTSFSVYMAALIACLGAVSFGYSLEYASPSLPELQEPSAGKLQLNRSQSAWFTSLIAIGGLIGAPVAGFLIDFIGRQSTLIVISLPFVAGWLLIIYAEAVVSLLIGRLICGLGVGMASLVVPIYIAEISTAESRGMLGSMNQLSVTIGFLLGAVLALGINWNYLALVGMVLPILMALGIMFMPETPRYLLAKGKRPMAIKQLKWLRGSHADINTELYDIENNLDNGQKMHFSEFKNPVLFKPLLISIGLMIFQQFSGINAVLFFCTYIFKEAGFGDPKLVNLIATSVQVGATLISVMLVDRLGRRVLLITPAVIMAISCTTFGVYYYIQPKTTTNLNWLAMLSLFVYLVAFSMGWGAIPWLMMSELFPARARGIASGIATLINWTAAFTITYSFIYMRKSMKDYGTFWFFAAWNLLAAIFVFFCVPETKGKTLEEIERLFVDRKMNTEES